MLRQALLLTLLPTLAAVTRQARSIWRHLGAGAIGGA